MAGGRTAILLVEDDTPAAVARERELQERGYAVRLVSSAASVETALVDSAAIDLLLIDPDPGKGMDRTEVAASILQQRELPIVFLTSLPSAKAVAAAREIGVYGCVASDASVDFIDASIRTALGLFEKAQKAARRSQHLDQLCSLAKIGIWEYDPRDQDLSLSVEASRILELCDSDEIDFARFLEFYPGESSGIVLRAINLAIEEGKHFVRDCEIVLGSGRRKWIRTQGEPIPTGSSATRRLFGIIQDLSEIRQLDRVTQESELTLSQVEQITHIGHWSVDLTSGTFFHSDEIKRIFGYEPSEYALSVEEAINAYHPDDRAEVVRLFNRAVETGEGYEFDLRVVQPSGNIRSVRSMGYAEKNAEGKVTRVYGVFQDTTEITKSLQLIEQSRMLLRASLESQQDTTLLSIDQSYRYLFFNQSHADAMRLMYGKDVQIGSNILESITSSEDREAAKSNYDRALRGESHTNIRKYGEGDRAAWFESFYNPVYNQKREIIGATAMARDITARKLTETALQESHARYHALFEQAGDGIIMLDRSGSIISVNDTFATMHGRSADEIIQAGIGVIDVAGSKDLRERLGRIMAGETLSFEVEHYHRDGHVFPLLVTANLVDAGADRFIMAIHRDLSERKRMEEELLKVQKLESLGVLAGGIAHDFNNLMAGILGYVAMAAAESTDEAVSSDLNRALETMDRARALTGQLLTFAKGGAPVKALERLAPHIMKNAKFALSGSNVSCQFTIPDDLWPCELDKNQIGQVVNNLVINAQQAMPEGGAVEIAASNLSVIEGSHAALPAGAYVRIAVTDHGIGMPKEILAKLFDPFFTTKRKGHGLGLATSHSIVRRHGGCIEVTSEQGKGSTFAVYLPAAPEQQAADSGCRTSIHRGSGLILLMDDEQIIRDTIGSMLKRMGYGVHCTANVEETLEIFCRKTAENARFAAVVVDLTIPGGRGGREALEEIRKIDREVPAFVTSGYAEDPVMANPTEYGFDGSIPKPFSATELAALLDRHLSKPH